jgi:hypothetical protein
MKHLVTLLLIVMTGCVFAADNYTSRTQYTNIHYDLTNRDLASYLAGHIDSIVEELLLELGSPMVPLIDINLYSDRLDFNAGAYTTNESTIVYFQVPFVLNELIDNDNYVLDTLRHELAHSISARITSEFATELSKLIQLPFWTPNAVVPSGFQEGLAQVMESNLTTNAGRGFGYNSYYNSLWLSEWRNGFMSFADFSAVHDSDSHVRAYLYGANFFSYLTERFGDEAISQWLSKRSNDIHTFSNPLFGLNYSWQEAFNESLDDSWRAFTGAESHRLDELYGRELSSTASLLNAYVGSYRNEGLVSFYTSGSADYYVAPTISLGKHRFGFYKNGEKIATVHLPKARQVALVSDTALYYLQQGECQDRQASDLVYFDLDKEKHHKLTHCGQVLTFDVNHRAQTIVALVKDGSGSSVKTFNLQGQELASHWQGDFKQQISALKLSPDGSSVLLALKPALDSVWNLYQLQLASNVLTPLTDDSYIQRSPTYVNQAEIVYTRAFQGIEQVFHLNIATGVESQVTRHNYGVIQPVVLGDSLYTLGYQDMDLQLRIEPFELIEPSQVFSPQLPILAASSPSAPADLLSQPYRFIESFKVQGLLPILGSSTDDGLTMGLLLLAADAKRDHKLEYQATAALGNGAVSHRLSYTFKDEISLRLQNTVQDDTLVNGYNLSYHNFQSFGQLDVIPVVNVTARQSHLVGTKVEEQWLAGGLMLGTIEGCDQFTITCSGWQVRAIGENKNGFKSAGLQNNISFAGDTYWSLGHSMAANLGLNSRYAFEDNQFSLGRVDDASLLSPLIGTGFNQRGYQAPLQGRLLSQVDARITKQWAPSRTLGTVGIALDTVNVTPYLSTGFDDQGASQMTAGIELGVQSTLLWNFSIPLSAGYAQGLAEEGRGEFYLSWGINF